MRGTQYLVWVGGQQHPPRYRGDPPARARGRAPRSLGLEEAAGAQRDALHLLLLLLVHSVPPAEAGDPVSIPTGDDLRLLGAAPGPELGLQHQGHRHQGKHGHAAAALLSAIQEVFKL